MASSLIRSGSFSQINEASIWTIPFVRKRKQIDFLSIDIPLSINIVRMNIVYLNNKLGVGEERKKNE